VHVRVEDPLASFDVEHKTLLEDLRYRAVATNTSYVLAGIPGT